jgi:hypothetical protein
MPRRIWRSIRREWDQLLMQIGASIRRMAAARAAGRRCLPGKPGVASGAAGKVAECAVGLLDSGLRNVWIIQHFLVNYAAEWVASMQTAD